MVKPAKPEYIVDSEGHKTKVILPVEAYEELLEDLHDLSVAFERKGEPRIPFEELEESLKKMASYKLVFSRLFEKDVRKLPKETVARIISKTKALAEDPLPNCYDTSNHSSREMPACLSSRDSSATPMSFR